VTGELHDLTRVTTAYLLSFHQTKRFWR